MLNSLNTQQCAVGAMLNEIGGDPLEGSGFEADEPQRSFVADGMAEED